MSQFDPEIQVIKNQLLPLVDGVTTQEYRLRVLSIDCTTALWKQGYHYLGCGACSTVWSRPGSHYVIKVWSSDGLDVPLTCNPTRELWDEIVALGLEQSKKSYCMPPYPNLELDSLLNRNGFIPKYVKHFLFFDYLHPDGLFAVQKKVDISVHSRIKAERIIGFESVHSGNYGMDGDRPVIIDWY